MLRTYSRDRHNDRFLIRCLILYINDYDNPENFGRRFGLWLVSLLEKIEPHLVAKEIDTFKRALHKLDEYVRLLIHLLGDDPAWQAHHDRLTRALADLPADLVRRNLQSFEELAYSTKVQVRHIDGIFVELLTRAGAWEAAARLAHSVVAALPDDTWNRLHKLIADQIWIATEFEAALASGSTERARSLAAEWKSTDEAIKKDSMDNAERRDPLWGIRK